MIIKMDFKKLLSMFLVLAIILGSAYLLAPDAQDESDAGIFASSTAEDSYIKWVDFDIPASLLEKAMNLDVETYEDETRAHIDWIELLAYLAVKCGGDFDKHKTSDYNTLVEKLEAGSTVSELADGMEHYDYYLEAYTAVLGGFLGEYEIQEGEDKTWTQQYGLKVFSPLADGYYFTHSDDFGNGRSYGYQRKHLGHDLMAAIGTPVVAVESGVVEELGWHQYGGWRVGIRCFDGQRYYYYAQLRQNRPYAEGLEQGQVVMAGDVIGYVGRTGYSTVENTNGMQENHLHLGLQLIFDESQKDGVNEIWIDLYQLTLFLQNHKSQTWRDSETK
ncbi:MAG: M23 family metallopeptidase [Clostridiales bacterium]|nr:M23 family metallopeptidase [Clostridiales bacterium]